MSFLTYTGKRLKYSNHFLSYTSIFDIGTGFNNTVDALNIGSNGKVYVGGEFSKYNNVTYNHIVGLNSDGTVNTGFNVGTGISGYVYHIVLDSSGKIYVGGNFSEYKGLSQNSLIRLNTDGTKDASFDIGTGFYGLLSAVATVAIDYSTGKIYVGGGFDSYKDVSISKLIRLNTDGTKDTSFVIGASTFDSFVQEILLDSSEKVYAGGNFTTFNGSTQHGLIRLNTDGTKDTAFDISDGFGPSSYGYVYALAIDTNGKIYVGGAFTTYRNISQNCLIRLNTDGTKDTTFDISDGFNATAPSSPSITTIVIDSNGKIYVGGVFNSYRNSSQNCLIRLNTDGTKDTTFDISNGFTGGNNNVDKVVIDSSGKIYAAGNYTAYKDVSQNCLIRLDQYGNKN
jgi:uncharacterized delta-60 repeat protein